MKISWNDLTFLPSQEALTALESAWSWRLPKNFEPVFASTLGDIFFQDSSKAVFWLNTGTAEITRVAESREHFLERLKGTESDEWLLPSLIQKLIASGKTLKPDYCYTFVIPPIFEEGSYDVSNFNPVPAKEHFSLSGQLHLQIKDLSEGAKVQIKIQT